MAQTNSTETAFDAVSGILIPVSASFKFLCLDNSLSQCFQRNSLRCILTLSSHQLLGSPSGLFLSGFVIKILHEFRIAPTPKHVTYMSRSFYPLGFITVQTSYEALILFSLISHYFLFIKFRYSRMLLFSNTLQLRKT